MNKPSDKRLRQLRLNIAYMQSERNLDQSIQRILGGEDYKLHIRHHSHQLATHVKNAMRYNRDRTNGITVVVLESPALARPVFGYSVCSVEDTYSRLIGRTLAKENLVKTLVSGSAQVLPAGSDLLISQSRDKQLHRYINHIVTQVAPRLKPATKDQGVNPLVFVNEDSLNLEIKQLIAKKFGVDTKEIQNHFEFIRRFNNKYFGNQFATFANIQEYSAKNPNDAVELDSTGGFTLGVFTFKYEGTDHLLYAVTHCSPEDHYNKSFGRKSAMLAVKSSNIFKDKPTKDRQSKLAGIFRLSVPMEKDVMLNQLALHAVSERYGIVVNNYVGGAVA